MGERAGLSSTERAELAAVKRTQRAKTVVARLADRALPAKLACGLLEASQSGLYHWRSRPTSPAALRRESSPEVITEIHTRPRGGHLQRTPGTGRTANRCPC